MMKIDAIDAIAATCYYALSEVSLPSSESLGSTRLLHRRAHGVW